MTTSQKLRASFELDAPAFHSSAQRQPADEVPAIRAVADIFERAVKARASDVHLEPRRDGGRVRQRVDGVLHEVARLAADDFLPVVSRIKLVAGMDIADRRVPQDGRYTAHAGGRAFEARVSSMPTLDGEKLVVRLLDSGARVPALAELGMPPPLCEAYRRRALGGSGLVVACGPTGCGKTTTLYASMAARDADAEHLCSVEDPIELRVPGVTQVQVNARAGVTFASALRGFLRQDPDAIMVGEIRDTETAAAAVAAALCGRVVFATLHAADAVCALDRLQELGISPRRIANATSCVLAQRLVRKLCGYCKEGSLPRGCERCEGSGFYGRTGVFELLEMALPVRAALERGATPQRLRSVARGQGYEPMRASALPKALDTTPEEIARVLGDEASG